MKLSTKGRYGARAMLDLAIHNDEQPILLKDVAKRQDISIRYLENIMTALVAADLVRSTRGRHGGFALSRSPSGIRLSEIIYVLEGGLFLTECVKNKKYCKRSDVCVTNDIWKNVQDKMMEVLKSITLKDMVDMHLKKTGKSGKGMYYI
ncbi:Rrf2 family transcriptional regulator [bacterium]|nr:Rrf2 family transcriptional regulator [bacterium]